MIENHSDCDHEIGTCQIYGYYLCPHDNVPVTCVSCLNEFVEFEEITEPTTRSRDTGAD